MVCNAKESGYFEQSQYEPDILLADEPTASLDPGNAKIVLESISKLNRNGTTVVLVTHNPDILQKASRSIILD